MITAEVLTASQGLDALRAAWDRLYGASERDREPSLSFGWSRAIARNHLAGNRDWFTMVLRRDAEVAAIIPMLATRERLLGSEVITLAPIQEKNNTHTDLLIGTDTELLGAWLDQLMGLKRRWDLLNLSRLLEGSPLLEALPRELKRRGLKFRTRLEQPSYYLRLPASFDAYLAARSGKFRNYLRRAEKRLATMGDLQFEVVGRDACACFDELLEIERGSWKHQHGTAISAVEHQTGFYRDLCDAARESGVLHLSFLRLDGRALAYNLGLIAGGRYYYLKTSYLHEFRESGAATVGRARLIQHLIERGLTEFDFPAEPYEWERQWTDEARWHRSLMLFNRGIRGRALWLVSSLRERLRSARGRQIKHTDARALQAPVAETAAISSGAMISKEALISSEALQGADALAALATEWNQLAGASSEPMQSHDWVTLAAGTLHPGAPLHVLVVRRGKALAAVVALVEERRGGMRWLSIPGAAALGEPVRLLADGADARRELCRAMLALRLPMALQRLDGDEWVQELRAVAGRRATVVAVSGGACLRVELGAERQGYMTAWSTERRATLRRKRRQLEKTAPLRLESQLPTPPQVADTLRAAFEVEARSWKGAAGSSVLQRPPMFEFFRALGEKYAADGRLLVRSLSVGEKVIATHVSVVQGERCFELKIGYDAEWSRYSPGVHLTCECLEDSFDRGHRVHEFLGSAADWQRPFATGERRLHSVVVYPLTLAGVSALSGDVAAFAWRRVRRVFGGNANRETLRCAA